MKANQIFMRATGRADLALALSSHHDAGHGIGKPGKTIMDILLFTPEATTRTHAGG